MWLKITLIAIAILFIVVLIIKRFAYFRPTFEFMPPRDTFQDIYEGNIHAWYKRGQSGKVILFCHGNAGNLSHRQGKLIEFLKMGHSVLIFDYSGFGHSKGVPNEQLCYDNASRMVDLLRQQGYKTSNIIPYGESLGAAVAAYTGRKYGLSKVIIESGLPSIKAVIKSWNKILGNLLGFLFYEFNTIEYLNPIQKSIPVEKILILHSKDDEIIPYEITEELRSLGNSVDMTGSHNSPNIPWKIIEEFISS